MPIQRHDYQDTETDLQAVQAALSTWIQMAGGEHYCHVGDVPHRIYNGQRGRYHAPSLMSIWKDDGEIIAFSLHEARHKMWEAFLHPNCRGDDIEREVLQSAETATLALMPDDADAIKTGYFETDTARKNLLTAMGYEIGEVDLHYTQRPLSDGLPMKPLVDGFRFQEATLDAVRQLGDVHEGAFGTAWTNEEYRYVMTSPGYDPKHEIVVVAPDGRYAAFCVYWLDSINKIGLFEPVGVHKDFHRKGLASALMIHVMHLMREAGIDTVQIGHELENPASTNLYAKLGFKKFTGEGLATKQLAR